MGKTTNFTHYHGRDVSADSPGVFRCGHQWHSCPFPVASLQLLSSQSRRARRLKAQQAPQLMRPATDCRLLPVTGGMQFAHTARSLQVTPLRIFHIAPRLQQQIKAIKLFTWFYERHQAKRIEYSRFPVRKYTEGQQPGFRAKRSSGALLQLCLHHF